MARKLTHVLALLSLAAFSFGCQKSHSTPASAPATAPAAAQAQQATKTVLLVHWVGKKALALDTNAAVVMKIWNMPESARLQAQTLDKLSASPWHLIRGETNQSSTNLLRPLLQDLVDEESYIQIDRATNAENEMVLAVHLNNQRAGLWETNLAAVFRSLTGIGPTPPDSKGTNAGWSLKKHHAPNLIEFARAGDWVVLGAAEDHNNLLDQALDRIGHGETPIAVSGTNKNCWLEGSANLPRVAEMLGLAGAELPRVSFAMLGESQKVRTHGEIVLPDSRAIDLNAWNIPTNLIDGNLAGFTAIRGLKPWLADSRAWTNLQVGPPPDQLCVWALRPFPMQTYFAAPLADASNAVSHLTDLILEKGAPWFASHKLAGFKRAETYNGLAWLGLPYATPFLQSVETNGSSFVFGGFFHADKPTQPLPPALLTEVFSHTNLVYYDWELTNLRIDQWLYLGQFLRFVSGKAQLPNDSAALVWLKAIAPHLESCTTEIIQTTTPGRLSFARTSTTGFSAIELHLLADWLESPEFPRGFHTLLSHPVNQAPDVRP